MSQAGSPIPRLLRTFVGVLPPALVGVVSAGAGIGVAHAVAAVTVPAASPLLAVGSIAVDAAPTPVKEWAVATFGTADKPILLSGIAVALLVVTAAIGVGAFRRRWIGIAGMLALAAVAAASAAARIPGLAALLPALVAGVVSVATIVLLTRALAPETAGEGAESAEVSGPPDDSPLAGPNVRSGRFMPNRRGLLIAAPAAVAIAGIGAGVALRGLRTSDTAVGRDQELPAPESAAPPLPAGVELTVPGFTPFITPNPDFYRVDIALSTPRLDTSAWELPISGMVDNPVTLRYADILEMPLIERHITLSCVSNPVGGPYVSTAKWLGVPLRDLMDQVGVQPGAEQIYATGADGFSCSVPLDVALDGRDAMLVVGMNGEQLPFDHGYPARLLVPGLFGFVSAAKWLTGMTLSTYADDVAYWTEREWATDAPALTQTRIDVPAALAKVPAGEVTIAGMAWAQHRGITKVEVKIDDEDWQEADLATDAGADLWRSWSLQWTSTGPGRHDVQVRSTDSTGQTQPQERTDPFPDGARGWHSLIFNVEG